MTAVAAKPTPELGDPLSGPFWAALERHEIVAQRCVDCGRLRWPIAETCPGCLGSSTRWDRLPDEGRIWSHVEYHRAFHRGFADETPYVIVLVDVAEGIRLPGRLVRSGRVPEIGSRVLARFERADPGPTLLGWQEAPGEEAPREEDT